MRQVNGQGRQAMMQVNGQGRQAMMQVNGQGRQAMMQVNGQGRQAMMQVNGQGRQAMRQKEGWMRELHFIVNLFSLTPKLIKLEISICLNLKLIGAPWQRIISNVEIRR